jgi:hypothetical protein
VTDARALNWRYTVPTQRRRLLFLPVSEERFSNAVVPERSPKGIGGVLSGRRYATVVAPDVSAWRKVAGGRSSALVGRLADAVEPGGWLYIGFPNYWYAARPMRAGSLSLRSAVAAVLAAGLNEVEPYLALPDLRCPAFLIGAGRREELDYFLGQLFFPYSPANTGWGAVARGLLLPAAAALVKWAPHRPRVQLAPALALVARRPA